MVQVVFSWPPNSEARGLAIVAVTFAIALCGRPAHATGKQGEFIQTDTLGMSLLTRDLDHGTTRSVRNAVNLSEFMGLHGYVIDRLRLGANFQLTERVWPKPPPGGRIQRVAVLPQVGWNFYDPFFTAVVFGFAPRTDGKEHLNLSLQAVLGVSLPISKRVRLSIAGEVPYTFYDRHMLGVTALTGISIRL